MTFLRLIIISKPKKTHNRFIHSHFLLLLMEKSNSKPGSQKSLTRAKLNVSSSKSQKDREAEIKASMPKFEEPKVLRSFQ